MDAIIPPHPTRANNVAQRRAASVQEHSINVASTIVPQAYMDAFIPPHPMFLFRPNTYRGTCMSIEHIYMRPSRLKRYIE